MDENVVQSRQVGRALGQGFTTTSWETLRKSLPF
jgi:hypothetical protein